jgi:hypothetical protein
MKKSFPYYKIYSYNLTEKNLKNEDFFFFFFNFFLKLSKGEQHGHGKVFPVTRDKNAIQASNIQLQFDRKK